MKNFFSFLMATVDGYYEGPNQEFDFWTIDDEFHRFAAEQLDKMDTLVLGRVTYEGMAGFWPTPAADDEDPRITERMNGISKVVVSRTLDKADWANSRIVRTPEELAALKQEPGRDMAVFGSSALTVSLLQAGLIDEVRIMVNPVVIGAGKSLFRTASERVGLELTKSRPFDSGNVLLYYAPGAAGQD
jgi:dihydrofolate reductase